MILSTFILLSWSEDQSVSQSMNLHDNNNNNNNDDGPGAEQTGDKTW